jgi:hypothetical protein
MKALFLSIFISAILIATPLFGATFPVTNPTEFQAALTAALTNLEDDVINVAAGTYTITSTLTYSTPDGDTGHTLTIQGAGAGSTILDGGGVRQIMRIDITGGVGFVSISGLTFIDGSAASSGGGVYVRNNLAAITITDNIFTDNSCINGNGGGASLISQSAVVTLTGNTFTGNSADTQGGGVFAASDSNTVTLTGNTFTGNSAPVGGGANVYSGSGSIAITNNVFDSNDSPDAIDPFLQSRGGGVFAESDNLGPLTITNNTFYGNTCFNFGGGVYLYLYNSNVQANVYNNIFWANVASNGGNDGDDLYVNSDPERTGAGAVGLFNNDFSGSADFISGQSEDLFITVTDNYAQGSNIQVDPLFVNAGAGDLHLQSGSPAVNVGTNSAPSLPTTDFEGDPRILEGIVDMGADEYRGSGAATPVPAISALGMVVFMIFAGTGAVYCLRRQRRDS